MAVRPVQALSAAPPTTCGPGGSPRGGGTQMNRYRWILVAGLVLASAGIGSAFTLVVTDPAVTVRNAVTAVLKNQIVDTLVEQHGRLRRMARRLSAFTNLDKYAASDVPRWRTHDWERGTVLYGYGYHGALTFGDATGGEYE